MKHTPVRLLTGLTLVLALAACGGSSDKTSSPTPAASSSSSNSVTIKTFAFQPNPVQVKVGDTITWTNQDQILHTVTSGTRGNSNGMFDQKLDGVGSKAMFTFSSAGTFAYHCEIHPGMDATVEVS